jgi:hypothetical protein
MLLVVEFIVVNYSTTSELFSSLFLLFSQPLANDTLSELIPDLLPKGVALFNQQARGRRLPLSEGDFPMESERKRFSTRGARFRSARETLLC